MELEIREKRENHLLDRVEVKFVISHPNQPTPRRENVREALSSELKVPKDRVVVDHMNSSFGVQDTVGYAKVYSKKEVAMEVERKYLLIRNKFIKEEKKAKPAPEEAEPEAEAEKEAEEGEPPAEEADKKEEKKPKKKDKPPEEEKKSESKPKTKKKADKEEAAEEPAKEE